jgi:hypothetical protein
MAAGKGFELFLAADRRFSIIDNQPPPSRPPLAKPRGDEPVAKAFAVFHARAPAAHRIVSKTSNTLNESTSGLHNAAQMTMPPKG